MRITVGEPNPTRRADGAQYIPVVREDGRTCIVMLHPDGRAFVMLYVKGEGLREDGPYTRSEALERAKASLQG